MVLFRLYLNWTVNWNILPMLLRYAQFLCSLLSPNIVLPCFWPFSWMTCCSLLAECLWSTTSRWYRLRCTSVSIPVNHSPHQGNASGGYRFPDTRYAQLLLYHPGWLNVPSLALCTMCLWWIQFWNYFHWLFFDTVKHSEIIFESSYKHLLLSFIHLVLHLCVQKGKPSKHSTLFCWWAPELFGQFYCIKDILQSWKAALHFVAAYSGCVGLLINLKGFFSDGKGGC